MTLVHTTFGKLPVGAHFVWGKTKKVHPVCMYVKDKNGGVTGAAFWSLDGKIKLNGQLVTWLQDVEVRR